MTNLILFILIGYKLGMLKGWYLFIIIFKIFIEFIKYTLTLMTQGNK